MLCNEFIRHEVSFHLLNMKILYHSWYLTYFLSDRKPVDWLIVHGVK